MRAKHLAPWSVACSHMVLHSIGLASWLCNQRQDGESDNFFESPLDEIVL